MQKTLKNSVFLVSALATLIPSLVFAYQAAPVAITKSPTFITEKSAHINGQANPNEMPDTYTWFEWGISGRTTIYETQHVQLGGWWGSNSLVDQATDLVGLAPSTQYFYRQVAENSRGRDVGQTVYFTTKALPITPPALAIIETDEPSLIADTNATLRGYVSPHGNTQTMAWFEWGISSRLEAQTPHTYVQPNAGPFESAVTNLTSGTVYFYRIVAENSSGRTYGVTRTFVTTGLPPPPPEKPVAQNIPETTKNGDGLARTTTTSGTKLATNQQASGSNNSGDTQYGLPGVSSGFRPGDVFGALFRKKDTTTTTNNTNTSNAPTADNSANQVAGVAAATSPLGSFWNNLTGKRPVDVTLEKLGPKDVPAHTAVEYRVTYHYRVDSVSKNAQLKIVLPATVVYIGDNTANELLIQEGDGGERTYVLPVGRLENGSTRTISILGMTTADAKGFPDARARLEYDSPSGIQVVSSGNTQTQSTTNSETASAASSGDWSILPSSFLGWILYVVLVVSAIIGIRKAREYYERRKELIAQEEAATERGQAGGYIPDEGAPASA